MVYDWQAANPLTIILAITLVVVLALQGISVNGGISEKEIQIGTPHAVTGFVYWPNETAVLYTEMAVTITNNRTGESGQFPLNIGFNVSTSLLTPIIMLPP